MPQLIHRILHRRTARRAPLFLAVALLCGAGAAAELPTTWQVPPGDALEHEAAGYAKILCSAVFITGRELETAKREDGFFVAPQEMRAQVTTIEVDRAQKEVRATLPDGVTRRARQIGDQGCVTLPPGRDEPFFAPVNVVSALPDAESMDWPMGDREQPLRNLPPEIDRSRLDAAVAAAFEPDEGLTAAFLVVWRGQIIAERYGHGADAATRLPGWSMGKSITATLMGQLIQEDLYALWQKAPVAEWQGADDPRRDIRIADLLRMSSGLRFVAPQDPDYDPARGYADHLYVYTGAIDAFRWAITRPPQWPANSVGRYRNSDPLAINYLIQQAATARGEEYLSYPQRHLFDRLGIRRMVLETDAYGNFLLQGYELGPARDWARLGLLYLQGGLWNGERLLPEEFVDFVRTPAPAWERPIYGGFFWLNREGWWPVPEDAFFMAGSGGQYTLIVPTHDLVVVRLGHYAGAAQGEPALARALSLLMQAVPQARATWQPPQP